MVLSPFACLRTAVRYSYCMILRNEKEKHRAMKTPREAQMSIRPLTEELLDATDTVVAAAYHATYSRKDRLRRYLDLQPGGSFVALLDETVVLPMWASCRYVPISRNEASALPCLNSASLGHTAASVPPSCSMRRLSASRSTSATGSWRRIRRWCCSKCTSPSCFSIFLALLLL